MFHDYDDIVEIEGLMDILGIGKHTAYQLIRSGQIKAFKIGKVYKIRKEDIRQFVLEKIKTGL